LADMCPQGTIPLCDGAAGSTPPSISSLRLSCSAQGSECAIKKYNRHGDSKGFGDDAIYRVLPLLQQHPFHNSLRTLDLTWNHLGDAAMGHLACCWPKSLTELSLDWNEIGFSGAKRLGEALAHPAAAKLVSLDLRSNPLGDDGVIAICRGASAHTGLQWLVLGEASMTDKGACDALPHLCMHPALTGLDIGENLLTDTACEPISKVLEDTPKLQSGSARFSVRATKDTR